VKTGECVFLIFAIPMSFWMGAKITEILASLIVGLVVT
jgi:hypothetical protein